MKNFYSLSSNPGKTGEYFYNRLFAIHRLPYTYTALKCTDIERDLNNLIKNGAAGVSISMPFKRDVITHLTGAHPYVHKFNSCNSIKIENNEIYGHNTDVYGAEFIISLMSEDSRVTILGDGAMGSMFKMLLGDRASIYSRKLQNWNNRHSDCDVIVNCTSFGTTSKESPLEFIPSCKLVVDLALRETQLELQCFEGSTKYIGGLTFYKHQFRNQYKFYTGIDVDFEEIDQL